MSGNVKTTESKDGRMGRMQKDDERAREIAYTIRTKDMGQEEIVKLLVKLIEDVREETALAYW